MQIRKLHPSQTNDDRQQFPRGLFTVDEVRYIRSSSKANSELADEFGTRAVIIYYVRTYQTYAHVDPEKCEETIRAGARRDIRRGKLDRASVIEIFELAEDGCTPQHEIAQCYGVAVCMVNHIKTVRNYRKWLVPYLDERNVKVVANER